MFRHSGVWILNFYTDISTVDLILEGNLLTCPLARNLIDIHFFQPCIKSRFMTRECITRVQSITHSKI